MSRLTAQIARVELNAPAQRRSGTLILRPLAYLSVQVFFHQEPIEDLEVQFAKAGQDEQPGDAVGDAQRTDSRGIAKLGFMVPVGNYVCQIEHQPPAVVSTVEDADKPFILVLPIGRPYFDFDEDVEFDAVGDTS